jgi:hypothetical protein
MSEVPEQYRSYTRAYKGFCNTYEILMYQSKVEEHSALFRGGTKWFSSIYTSDTVENIPARLTENGGMLKHFALAALDFATGPWVNQSTSHVIWNPGWHLPGDMLRWHEFHMMNAMDNRPYTGYTEEFLSLRTGGNVWEKYTGLKSSDMKGSVNQFPLLKHPDEVFDKRLGQLVPSALYGNDIALVPYVMASKIVYKKLPASCTASFMAGNAALNEVYNAVKTKTCLSVETARDWAGSIASHWGTKEKKESIPVHGDESLTSRWSIPVYTPEEIDALDPILNAIMCDLTAKFNAFGCSIKLESDDVDCTQIDSQQLIDNNPVCEGC